MGLEKIIAITGKPGLYKVLNQSKNGFVIESLTDGKRTTLIGNQNVSTLKDIAIYTYDEEFPLGLIFKSMFEKEGIISLPTKKIFNATWSVELY